MPLRRILLALPLLCAGTLPLPAAAASTFTPDQRAEIVAIVRDAMKTDPSILKDAIRALQAQQISEQAAQLHDLIAKNEKALLHDPADQSAGNPNGDITLVEFYDPRCPYCRKMLNDIDTLLKTDPKLRLVYKDIPVLGDASTMEARAILAAKRQNAYVALQKALMNDAVTPTEERVQAIAKGIGLDPERLARDMKDPAIEAQIATNLQLAHDLHITGTPTFIVGQTMIPGAVSLERVQGAVAQARKG